MSDSPVQIAYEQARRWVRHHYSVATSRSDAKAYSGKDAPTEKNEQERSCAPRDREVTKPSSR
jgi:hypothetical protein